MGLQSVLGWWITKCGNSGLQSVLGVGLQSALQSALGFTKCGRLDYKVRQGLQSVAGLQNELVQVVVYFFFFCFFLYFVVSCFLFCSAFV